MNEYRCSTWVKSWLLGARGPFVLGHIESCTVCRTLIEGREGESSIQEEVFRALGRPTGRQARRRRIAAAALIVASIAFSTWSAITLSRSNETHSTGQWQRLDTDYDDRGASGIEELTRSDPGQLRKICNWLVARGRADLNGILEGALSHEDEDVRRNAARLVADDLNPAGLAALNSTLATRAAEETVTEIRSLIERALERERQLRTK